MAIVIKLVRYPVKGCAGTSLPDAGLTPAGLAHDRSFMVVDEDGVFRSQRGDPRLAVLRPEIGAGGAQLTLSAPGADRIRIEVDVAAARREVLMFGKPYRGIDQGDQVAEWLSDALGARSRLVRVPPEHDRVGVGRTLGPVGYADANAVLVTSSASLDLLNERIAENGGAPLGMDRFRPNIVVDGWAEPHTEDLARLIEIGGAQLGYAKLALRCVVTTVDQRSGVKAGPEPLRALAGYRRAQGCVAFGSTFAVTRPGKLAVGDAVKVAEWGESEA